MLYSKYNLSTPQPELLKTVIADCPYGILHLKAGTEGTKTGILVEIYYSDTAGISFRIAHSYKVMIEELLHRDVSLKLCNKEKNIYMVADVRISPVQKNGFLSRANLKGAITRFNVFRKDKSDQLIAYNNAV